MDPKLFAALVDGGIPFFGGLYITLLGFRVAGRKPGESPKYDDWHERHGGLLQVLGPLLMLFGAWLAANNLGIL